eukprot:1271015-Prymnesium_polylepis.1
MARDDAGPCNPGRPLDPFGLSVERAPLPHYPRPSGGRIEPAESEDTFWAGRGAPPSALRVESLSLVTGLCSAVRDSADGRGAVVRQPSQVGSAVWGRRERFSCERAQCIFDRPHDRAGSRLHRARRAAGTGRDARRRSKSTM